MSEAGQKELRDAAAVWSGIVTLPIGGGWGIGARSVWLGRTAVAASGERVILGRYALGYQEYAQAVGARYFDLGRLGNVLPEPVVKFLNRRFLDRAISRGDSIEFAHAFDAVRDAKSWFAWEIKYLMSRGYTMSDDMMRMIAPTP